MNMANNGSSSSTSRFMVINVGVVCRLRVSFCVDFCYRESC